jgi:hypothetical protein
MTLAVCFHLHCYQPERSDPWLDIVKPELSAFPYHDWNQRVTAECYRPNTAAAVLAPDRRLRVSCDNFAIASFDVVKTLHRWLATNAPDVDAVVRDAARGPGGQPSGAALASPAVHAILPLAKPEDREVLVAWGVADFKARFGFAPEGMWLPETAVDLDTLATLARHGIGFTVLMPQQANRVRAPGGAWLDVSGEKIDPSRAYFVSLPGGESMTVVFGHGPLSRELAFGNLLNDGATFVSAIRAALAGSGDDELIAIITDGETYGHHHEFGEMALAWAARELQAEKVDVTNLGAWLAKHPATWEVELATPSSWSCAHGVERWRSDCGCTTGSQPGWNQSWRAPLREALDWLRATLAEPIAASLRPLLGDPLAAFVDYGIVLAGEEAPEEFGCRDYARPGTSRAEEPSPFGVHELCVVLCRSHGNRDTVGTATCGPRDRHRGTRARPRRRHRVPRPPREPEIEHRSDTYRSRSLGRLDRAAPGRRGVDRRVVRPGAGGRIRWFLDAPWRLGRDRSRGRDTRRSIRRRRRRRAHPDTPAHRGRDPSRVHRGRWCRCP